MKVIAAIGVFDGVHLGHQKILKKLIEASAKYKAKSLVITFDPHPRKILHPRLKTPLLISLRHRLNLLDSMGIDVSFTINFTKALSRMKGETFVRKNLLDKFDLKGLIVGEKFFFGFKKGGNLKTLKRLSALYNFRLYTVRGAKKKNKFISSTWIRSSILKGDLKLAKSLLGRPVTLLGTVVRGRGIGRNIGFPTANIDPHHEAIPPSGVYKVRVRIAKRFYRGILNIGRRPTFGEDKDPTIELHIFNFRRRIYGRDIEVIFEKKMREERKFKSPEALKRQIHLDIQKASHN